MDASATKAPKGLVGGPAACWAVKNNTRLARASPLNCIDDAKTATIRTIAARDHKRAIVLAAIKGEALARRPDGRP